MSISPEPRGSAEQARRTVSLTPDDEALVGSALGRLYICSGEGSVLRGSIASLAVSTGIDLLVDSDAEDD